MSTLAAKLGVKPESACLVVGPAPDDVRAELMGSDSGHPRDSAGSYDVIVAFNPDRRALHRHTESLPGRLTAAGGLWLCWPKRSSGVATDIGEADVRDAGLQTGLVDNKVAAIDATWSGLRFVRRVADR